MLAPGRSATVTFPAMKRLVLPAIVLLAAGPLGAQQPEVLARIKTEGLMQSHVDSLAGHLFDVIGQRLTGSPRSGRSRRCPNGDSRTRDASPGIRFSAAGGSASATKDTSRPRTTSRS